MRIRLIAVGERAPAWVRAGFDDYAGRLPPPWRLSLTEIPQARRGKDADSVRLRLEAERLLAALSPGDRTVALCIQGSRWDTEELVRRLACWRQDARELALLIGGPHGLDASVLGRADDRWSLSPLTFPHMLVRVLLAEQIYRAWSILEGHPYHRA